MNDVGHGSVLLRWKLLHMCFLVNGSDPMQGKNNQARAIGKIVKGMPLSSKNERIQVQGGIGLREEYQQFTKNGKKQSKIPKSKRICLLLYTLILVEKIRKFSIFSQVSHSYESRVKMGKGIGKIRQRYETGKCSRAVGRTEAYLQLVVMNLK